MRKYKFTGLVTGSHIIGPPKPDGTYNIIDLYEVFPHDGACEAFINHNYDGSITVELTFKDDVIKRGRSHFWTVIGNIETMEVI